MELLRLEKPLGWSPAVPLISNLNLSWYSSLDPKPSPCILTGHADHVGGPRPQLQQRRIPRVEHIPFFFWIKQALGETTESSLQYPHVKEEQQSLFLKELCKLFPPSGSRAPRRDGLGGRGGLGTSSTWDCSGSFRTWVPRGWRPQSRSQVDFFGRGSCLDHRQPFQTF